jgi:hypothetical protein
MLTHALLVRQAHLVDKEQAVAPHALPDFFNQLKVLLPAPPALLAILPPLVQPKLVKPAKKVNMQRLLVLHRAWYASPESTARVLAMSVVMPAPLVLYPFQEQGVARIVLQGSMLPQQAQLHVILVTRASTLLAAFLHVSAVKLDATEVPQIWVPVQNAL